MKGKLKTYVPSKLGKFNQAEVRRGVDVGSAMFQVTPVAVWHREGFFENDDEAKGAFRLAHQQGLDGMGTSVQDWMGLTEAEYDDWMRNDALPATKNGK